MTEKKKSIYAVTGGAYSDYQVRFITTDKDVASKAVELGAGDHVEEFPLLDRLPEKSVIHKASAWLDPNGHDCWHHRQTYDPGVQVWTYIRWDFEDDTLAVRSRPTVRTWTCGCGNRCTGVEAASTSSQEASVKACADRVAQLRAERMGIA